MQDVTKMAQKLQKPKQETRNLKNTILKMTKKRKWLKKRSIEPKRISVKTDTERELEKKRPKIIVSLKKESEVWLLFLW